MRPADAGRLCCITLDSSAGVLNYGLAEYVLQCASGQCQHGGACILLGGEKGCDCTGTGYDGTQCEIPLCSVGCNHGGTCSGPDSCVGCNPGWTGDFCGTVADRSSRGAMQAAALCVQALLLFACLLVIRRFRWRPIAARGSGTLILSMLGGVVWVEAATMQLATEDALFTFDILSPAAYELWALLVFGFGLWLGSGLVYLRAMCQIHIFYVVPLNAVAFVLLSLVPWILATLLSSYTVALLLAVLVNFAARSHITVFQNPKTSSHCSKQLELDLWHCVTITLTIYRTVYSIHGTLVLFRLGACAGLLLYLPVECSALAVESRSAGHSYTRAVSCAWHHPCSGTIVACTVSTFV